MLVVMRAHVVLVQQGALVLPMVVPVLRCVRCVGRASILRKDQTPVRSARLVRQMKTTIHRLHVRNVARAGLLDAVRHRAMSAQLARPTATSIPPRHVQRVWLVSTGKLRQLSISVGVINAQPVRLTWTLTAPHRALTVLWDSMPPLVALCARPVRKERSTSTLTHRHHARCS